MIFTVGNAENYRELLATSTVCKMGRRPPGDPNFTHGYGGGIVFETAEDAQRYIEEEGKPEWAVFGLPNAVWGVDTEPAHDGWWHYLLEDAKIVDLDLPAEGYAVDLDLPAEGYAKEFYIAFSVLRVGAICYRGFRHDERRLHNLLSSVSTAG